MGTDTGPDVVNGYPDFAAGTGRTWTLQLDESRTNDVVLSSCVRHLSAEAMGFTLTFLHPAGDHPDPRIEQGTYLLSRPGVEASPVFLVPVAQTAAGTELQAVFNQLVSDREAVS